MRPSGKCSVSSFWGGTRFWFIAFDGFHGVNTVAMADRKPAVWRYQTQGWEEIPVPMVTLWAGSSTLLRVSPQFTGLFARDLFITRVTVSSLRLRPQTTCMNTCTVASQAKPGRWPASRCYGPWTSTRDHMLFPKWHYQSNSLNSSWFVFPDRQSIPPKKEHLSHKTSTVLVLNYKRKLAWEYFFLWLV